MKKRYILYVVFVLIVTVFVFKIIYFNSDDLNYETVKVLRGFVANIVSVSGHVEPVSRVEISFPVGGRIVSMPVPEGHFVKKRYSDTRGRKSDKRSCR